MFVFILVMLKCRNLRLAPRYYNRTRKLPDKLIFESGNLYEGSSYKSFVMFSTKPNCKDYAKIICGPSSIVINKQKLPSLCIYSLFSLPENQGFGTAMLNFAQSLSKKLGCGGNFHLTATDGWMPNRVPHVFYRKYGMTSGNKKIDKKLDKFIKKHKDATHYDFQEMDMYFIPELQNKKPKSKLSKLFTHIKMKLKKKNPD